MRRTGLFWDRVQAHARVTTGKEHARTSCYRKVVLVTFHHVVGELYVRARARVCVRVYMRACWM